MKKILVLFLFLPVFMLAQNMDTTSNRIVVTEDVNECVQKIHDNPDAIKLLMSIIMSDKEKMTRLRDELMNDPAVRQMMHDARDQMMNEGGMHNDMHRNNEMEHQQQQTPPEETDTQQQPDDTWQQQETAPDQNEQDMEEQGYEPEPSDTTDTN